MSRNLRKSILRMTLNRANAFLKKFNVGIMASREIDRLQFVDDKTSRAGLQLISTMPTKIIEDMFVVASKSRSQLSQDLLVVAIFNFMKKGYFVEFGATNGIDLSNTFLLEKDFEWTGILAEPAKIWHTDLKSNRFKSHIDYSCVWNCSNMQLDFAEAESAELSTLQEHKNSDSHFESRQNSKFYKVQSISLFDLLQKYSAPNFIEYLSIDTEGSEYEILRSFDFTKYKFGVISCEHNYSSTQEKVNELLSGKGYIRVLPEISRWDAWYVHRDLYEADLLGWIR